MAGFVLCAVAGQFTKSIQARPSRFRVAGATAAYTLDEFLAEASAENGVVSVVGIHPGSTHVVVLTPEGVQTFEFLVTVLPPIYPQRFRSADRRIGCGTNRLL